MELNNVAEFKSSPGIIIAAQTKGHVEVLDLNESLKEFENKFYHKT